MADPGVGSYSGAGGYLNRSELLAAGGVGGAFGAAPTGADQMVYMGPSKAAPKPGVPGVPGSAAYFAKQQDAGQWLPMDAAQNYFAVMDASDYARVANATNARFGFDTASRNQTYVQSTYNEALSTAAYMTKATGQKVSLWDALDIVVERAKSAPQKSGGGGAGAYTGPVTTVRLTDPDTAMGLIDQSLQGALGRKASMKEKQRFLEALNKHEMANPYVQTGDQTGSVTTGGSNSQMFAERYAQSQEGVAEYATATTFLNAFMNALGSPV